MNTTPMLQLGSLDGELNLPTHPGLSVMCGDRSEQLAYVGLVAASYAARGVPSVVVAPATDLLEATLLPLLQATASEVDAARSLVRVAADDRLSSRERSVARDVRGAAHDLAEMVAELDTPETVVIVAMSHMVDDRELQRVTDALLGCSERPASLLPTLAEASSITSPRQSRPSRRVILTRAAVAEIPTPVIADADVVLDTVKRQLDRSDLRVRKYRGVVPSDAGFLDHVNV